MSVAYRFALVDGVRSRPTKGAKGKCEGCAGELIAHCGEILADHWAHRSKSECDDWYEPESEWHQAWKDEFDEKYQEIVIRKWGKHHRADYYDGKTVIEFQSSSISADQISDREDFYGFDMLWIINGEPLSFHVGEPRPSKFSEGFYWRFNWSPPRPSWFISQRRRYIDIGNGKLFRMHLDCHPPESGPWKGHGLVVDRSDFIARVKAGKPQIATVRELFFADREKFDSQPDVIAAMKLLEETKPERVRSYREDSRDWEGETWPNIR